VVFCWRFFFILLSYCLVDGHVSHCGIHLELLKQLNLGLLAHELVFQILDLKSCLFLKLDELFKRNKVGGLLLLLLLSIVDQRLNLLQSVWLSEELDRLHFQELPLHQIHLCLLLLNMQI